MRGQKWTQAPSVVAQAVARSSWLELHLYKQDSPTCDQQSRGRGEDYGWPKCYETISIADAPYAICVSSCLVEAGGKKIDVLTKRAQKC